MSIICNESNYLKIFNTRSNFNKYSVISVTECTLIESPLYTEVQTIYLF